MKKLQEKINNNLMIQKLYLVKNLIFNLIFTKKIKLILTRYYVFKYDLVS